MGIKHITLPCCTFTNGLIKLSKWNTRIYENRKCTSNKPKQNKIAFILYDYTTRFRLACKLVVRYPNCLQNWMRYVQLSSVLNQCFHDRTSADEHDKLIISFNWCQVQITTLVHEEIKCGRIRWLDAFLTYFLMHRCYNRIQLNPGIYCIPIMYLWSVWSGGQSSILKNFRI